MQGNVAKNKQETILGFLAPQCELWLRSAWYFAETPLKKESGFERDRSTSAGGNSNNPCDSHTTSISA